MNKISKRAFVVLLAVMMMLSALVLTSSAAATPKLNKTSVSILVGKTYTLKVSNYSKTVKWATSNKNVATVSSKGVVKAITTGTATITATAGSKKFTCKVTAQGASFPSETQKWNGHYYYVFKGTYTWNKAKALCEANGGYLATITSQQENDFVWNLARGKDCYYPWIGGYKQSNGAWAWVTGEKWSYTNWSYSQPDNNGGVEAYLSFYDDPDWNDYRNNTNEVDSFICEWDSTGKTGLSKTSASVYYGSTTTLKVNYTAASVTWSSSNTSVATVSSKGVVTGKAVGTATITAKTAGKSYTCKVTVKDKATKATVSFKCTTGGTFIKGASTATATFKFAANNVYKTTAKIVDATGKTVYTKTFTKVAKNTSMSFTWNGKKSDGTYVSAGSYRLTVTAGGHTTSSDFLSFKIKNDFQAGDGSKANPYQVKTVAQFKNISKYPKAYFKQIANLDFDYNAVGGFFTEDKPFDGQYDGANKTILNIVGSSPIFNYLGSKGVLKNMILKSCSFSSTQKCAALALYNYGSISDCKVYASVSTSQKENTYSGLIVCENYGRIVNCTASGSVAATSTERNCLAAAGGIAYYNDASGKIVNCISDVAVKAVQTNDYYNYDGYAYAGGIVETNRGSIIDCNVKGTISSVNYFTSEHALVGSVARYNAGTIINTEYTGEQEGLPIAQENPGSIVE